MATAGITPKRTLTGHYQKDNLFRVLSLDGGGAKGFYTLGVLKEIEALLGCPLYQCFDLVFGTSTGSIIAALIALGYEVDQIYELYTSRVPVVMKPKFPWQKSQALKDLADDIFGNKLFTDVKTGVGIVATKWAEEKPMIFKGDVEQAHGRKESFVPGFGCTISQAVQASCSAYPFFKRPKLRLSKGDRIELADGGYCANNPALYALADATVSLHKAHAIVRLVSVGVGVYPAPRKWSLRGVIGCLPSVRLLQKVLEINTQSMEQLRYILYKTVPTVRINDTFNKPEMAMDFMEYSRPKLDLIWQSGRGSFESREKELRQFLVNTPEGTHGDS